MTSSFAAPTFNARGSAWNFGPLGNNLGEAGLEVARIHGITEVFFASSPISGDGNYCWQVVRWDPDAQKMRQIYVSQHYEHGIDLLRLLDLDGDGQMEVIVGTAIPGGTGILEIYDVETKALQAVIHLGESLFSDAAMVDVDHDGVGELLVLTRESLLMVDGLESFPEGKITASKLTNAGGYRFHVGQLDGDAAMEILFTWGGVFEIGTWRQEWTLTEFDERCLVRGVIDRDGDGVSEIIVTTEDNHLVTLDLDSRAEVWRTHVDAYLPELHFQIVNCDADAALEFLLAGHEIITIDSQSGATESHADFPRGGADYGFIRMADIDDDRQPELIMWRGERRLMENWEELLIARPVDLSIVWSGAGRGGSFQSLRLADVNGDSRSELVLDGRAGIALIDPETQDPLTQIYAVEGFRVLAAKDVDGDGCSEVLMGSTTASGFREIRIYKFVDGAFSLSWSRRTQDLIYPGGKTRYESLDVADVDGDGDREIIGGWSLNALDVGGTHAGGIEAFKVGDGGWVWRSPRQYARFVGMAVGDLDNDEAIEIGATFDKKGLLVWEPGRNRQEFTLRGSYTCITPIRGGFAAGDKRGYVSRFSSRKSRGFARTSHQRAGASAIAGLTPHLDNEALWVATAEKLSFLPSKKRERFTINGEAPRLSPHAALYEGSGGLWLFGAFFDTIRGFPLRYESATRN